MVAKAIDLTGQLFGRWKAITQVPNIKRGATWLCECQCEKRTQRVVSTAVLRTGRSKSCGCLRTEHISTFAGANRVDLTNSTFGLWRVLSFSRKNDSGTALWLCECLCVGPRKDKIVKEVVGKLLVSGGSRSCGCLNRLKLGLRMSEPAQLAFYESLFTPEPHPSIGTFMDLV